MTGLLIGGVAWRLWPTRPSLRRAIRRCSFLTTSTRALGTHGPSRSRRTAAQPGVCRQPIICSVRSLAEFEANASATSPPDRTPPRSPSPIPVLAGWAAWVGVYSAGRSREKDRVALMAARCLHASAVAGRDNRGWAGDASGIASVKARRASSPVRPRAARRNGSRSAERMGSSRDAQILPGGTYAAFLDRDKFQTAAIDGTRSGGDADDTRRRAQNDVFRPRQRSPLCPHRPPGLLVEEGSIRACHSTCGHWKYVGKRVPVLEGVKRGTSVAAAGGRRSSMLSDAGTLAVHSRPRGSQKLRDEIAHVSGPRWQGQAAEIATEPYAIHGFPGTANRSSSAPTTGRRRVSGFTRFPKPPPCVASHSSARTGSPFGLPMASSWRFSRTARETWECFGSAPTAPALLSV